MNKTRLSLRPLDQCNTMADGRFLKGHGLNLYQLLYRCLELLNIWLRILSIVMVYSGISLLWGVNNAKLGYLWNPLDRYGMIVIGHFLRSRGFKLNRLQYECLKMLRIRATLLYTRVYRVCETLTMPSLGISKKTLDCCGTTADGRFLRGHGFD